MTHVTLEIDALPPMLDHANDVDGHEMVPSHLWGQEFGPRSAEIAELLDTALQKFTGNDFYSPGHPGDVAPASDHNVWHVRGSRAPSAVDMARRTEVLDVMGIDRQLIFPSYAIFANMLASAGEFMVRDSLGVELGADDATELGRAGLEEYNQWAIRTTAIDPDRLRAVAYVLPDRPLPELLQKVSALLASGIRAIHVPSSTPFGGLSPADPALDEFYLMLTKHQAVLLTHIGGEFDFIKSPIWGRAPAFKPGKVESHEVGLEPYSITTGHFSVCNYVNTMVLGGVFERHPTLAFGAIESQAHWLGPLADSMDMWAEHFHTRLAPFLSMKPSAYVARNVRVTPHSEVEPVERFLQTYPHLGSSYCFSSDYPHVEGGKDIKRRLYERLAFLGEDVVERYFVTNGRLLLPD